MRLDSVRARNFRTLQDINLTFARAYCTVSGRNNAGKSSVIRLLGALFRTNPPYPWLEEIRLDYREDKTQWLTTSPQIKIDYTLGVTREEDPALISFVEKIGDIPIPGEEVPICLTYLVSENESSEIALTVGGRPVEVKAAKEIDKRIKDSNLLFLYNSATPHEEYYLAQRGRPRMFYDFVMSRDEKRELDTAGKVMQKKLRRLAKDHTRGLREMLGKLAERYDVELSAPENYATRRMPVGISLKDRSVEVPLSDWGSGTQNRTHILMAILQASRIRTADSPDEKITPLVVIEEPESFLHPSAQAEFGRLLRQLSKELKIQIIVTTHSPYMLNQEDPGSNILLCRESRRGKPYGTAVVDTKGTDWMVPFSDHLGLAPEEFSSWQPIFSSVKSRVLLVEGPTDREYFRLLQQGIKGCDRLCPDIQVEAYGGKDTLKNTVLVQFVLRSFDRVFVTFDIDAEDECRSALTRAGLKESRDYMGVGLKQSGKDCIEGLLPERVLGAVNGAESDLVMKLMGSDNAERRKAKEQLKQKYLAEFKSHSDYSEGELRDLQRVVRAVNSKLANVK